jgi:hypothetical protein
MKMFASSPNTPMLEQDGKQGATVPSVRGPREVARYRHYISKN